MIVEWLLPPDLDKEASKSAGRVAMFKREIDQLCDRIQKRNENMEKAYVLVYGQCSEAIKSKLKSLDGFNSMAERHDLLTLLKSIESIMSSYQTQQQQTHALVNASRRLASMVQRDETSIEEYYE